MQTAAANPYLANTIMSASPIQLVVLLHDGLIRFLSAAKDGFLETDPQRRFETIHNNLVRAQNIIIELNTALDMDKGGEISAQLRGLYDFFATSLRQMNYSKQPEVLDRIINMVSELRDGWNQVANPGSGVRMASVTSSQQIAITS
jgi:flagellar secretion chaperone FliS